MDLNTDFEFQENKDITEAYLRGSYEQTNKL